MLKGGELFVVSGAELLLVGVTNWTKAVRLSNAVLMLDAAMEAASRVVVVLVINLLAWSCWAFRLSKICWMAACRWSLTSCGNCLPVLDKTAALAANWFMLASIWVDSGWRASSKTSSWVCQFSRLGILWV